jgi:ABC-2 type transport system permease protein
MASTALSRVRALVAKEGAELRAAKGVLAAPLLMLLTAVVVPFVVIIGVPAWSGETLDDAEDVVELAREMAPAMPVMAELAPDAAVQAFLLHQFLPLLLLVPVIGAMTLVTTSIVGEKQARSLEPLLATPITTAELLGAKTAVAFLVALALLGAGFGSLVAGAAMLAQPGVAGTLFTARPLALVTALAPAAAAAALVVGVVASSRARDARTAQQFGVVVVLPVVALFIAQLGGRLLHTGWILAAAALLWAVAALLTWIGVHLFDREHILTKWT